MICTNAILLERFVKQVAPSPYLSFNIHIDGMRETHDRVVDREGVFDTCVKMIKMLKEKGYRVQTNTTIFRETTADEIEELVKFLTGLGVDGMLLTPGYHYQVLDQRRDLSEKGGDAVKFERVRKLADELQDHQYADLSRLPGRRARSASCSPWTTVTRNPHGWKGPCYLITNGHYKLSKRCMRRPIGSTTAPSRTSDAAIASSIRASRAPSRWISARTSRIHGGWCAITFLRCLNAVPLRSSEGARG